ncbi:sensor histidine kinase [Staphylococcus muscae]|uniref:Heme sensor protein HssS n=1 Tax=Staphylococcus muscae TaxID=1294 RepID=A0A240C989_9STAP|nr:HAMP domain-containing sensor histidine kinase [Staphylococcus muscae]AVQ33743.1 sensor histidine kinase [Staphylococcus muscae]PNZ03594.1 sensor histidine kinase [Staphylococcus muscae]GGA87391.1 heme sensor protein HssS [Staphylococcus muscae]SNW04142.1 signal transduction histidine kinase HssS [Staphylococcus muscae]
MFKSLYYRLAFYTITVMLISAMLSFLVTNVYYHFVLKEQNDAKIMTTLQRANSSKNMHNEASFSQYLNLLGDLNYQVIAVDEKHNTKHYGAAFRQYNLSVDTIDRVLAGEDYHGIRERPFNPVITGFFDNESRNTVGMRFETTSGNYAVFIRPDINYLLGEFRYFLVVLIFLLVAFSIILVIWSTYALVKPVKQLKTATERMMAGDFTTPIAVTRTDEIGTLQQHFDSMRVSLKQLDDMRQHFVQNVSHEFKTPLTHIHHLLTQLQNESNQETQTQYIQRIYNETHRLSQLTQQLLLLSEMDNGGHLQFDETFQMNMLIQDILTNERYTIEQKSLSIVYELADISYIGNQRLLTQAIGNIIRNAIKYTPEFGMIDINLSQQTHSIVISVEDDGPGMDTETISHIFERFYKASAHTDSNGLGLSITQSIIERHGGSIDVQSTPNIGTVFTMTLPHT